METADFIISDIRPRPGHSLRYLHLDCEGAPCYIEDINAGTRALIMYKPEYDTRFHRLHTSLVESVEREKDDRIVKITTMNTIYTLTRINFDAETYRGVRHLTLEEARAYAEHYISEGAGKKLMETIYKDKQVDLDRAAASLLNAVQWLGEPRDHAIYHVFWEALCEE